jgi:hypothetical protein
MKRSFQKAGVVRDPEAYSLWNRYHTYCQVCGIPSRIALAQARPLSTHHLIKKARSDEPCNLLRLCLRCHNLAELLQIEDYPLLTLAILLTVKSVREPDGHAPSRLSELLHKNLPDPMPIPSVFVEEFRRWQTRR